LGWVHFNDLGLGSTNSPRESFEKAMDLVQKALAMDDSNPNAHCLLSTLYTYKREHDKGIAEGERAVALDPGGAIAHQIYASSLLWAGQVKEAIPMFQKSIRLNPQGSTSVSNLLGLAYSMTGRFEDAVSAYKQAIHLSPDNIAAHLNLAVAYIRMNREMEARAEAAEALRINPKFSLDNHAKAMAGYFSDKSSLDRYISLLRKAGLK
jgi:adenylate cyclase